MRTLAIGDIHGCLGALLCLIEQVRPGPDDTLVTLGDYVDRGPDSFGVLEWLIDFGRTGRLVALRGNHEEMMLTARGQMRGVMTWLMAGGLSTLRSYPATSEGEAQLEDVPEAHWEFLRHTCRPWYETDTHLFAHAAADPDRPLAESSDEWRYWTSFEMTRPHVSGKVLVCGHIAQRSGVPRDVGHAVCIDTGAYGGGWLTCLDVASGEYWQANEGGAARQGRLTR